MRGGSAYKDELGAWMDSELVEGWSMYFSQGVPADVGGREGDQKESMDWGKESALYKRESSAKCVPQECRLGGVT